jgi:hypothetical protein
MERRITADLLRLDSSAILDSITDSARRDHARKVLDNCVQTLADCESRRQIADLMEENIRILTKVQETLNQTPPASGSSGGALLSTLSEAVPARALYIVVAAIVSTLAAAITGSRIDWSHVAPPPPELHEEGRDHEDD